jgi:hypothetical protein
VSGPYNPRWKKSGFSDGGQSSGSYQATFMHEAAAISEEAMRRLVENMKRRIDEATSNTASYRTSAPHTADEPREAPPDPQVKHVEAELMPRFDGPPRVYNNVLFSQANKSVDIRQNPETLDVTVEFRSQRLLIPLREFKDRFTSETLQQYIASRAGAFSRLVARNIEVRL